jgi:DeoR family transcriptional regulator, L-fucose operon activator
MLALQRQRIILKALEQDGAVKVSDLAKQFDVTEETIRRDLSMLENAGRVTRSHGGAVMTRLEKHEIPHTQREITNRMAKSRIAEEALSRVNEGDSMILDASSSALFLAQLLPDIPLTVITNSVPIVQALSSHKLIRLIAVGGEFSRATVSFQGSLAENNLMDYHVNKLFFSCWGVDAQRGLSDPNEFTARLKQKMLGIADERILLADHSKFNVRAFSVIADVSAVTEIITDHETPETQCQTVRACGVTVTSVAPWETNE